MFSGIFTFFKIGEELTRSLIAKDDMLFKVSLALSHLNNVSKSDLRILSKVRFFPFCAMVSQMYSTRRPSVVLGDR